jgi:hypothetical protein
MALVSLYAKDNGTMKQAGVISSIPLFAFFAYLGCSNPSSPPQGPVYIRGNTYVNDTIGIRITVPDGWELTKDPFAGNPVILVKAERSATPQTTINLTAGPAGSGTTAAMYLDSLEYFAKNIYQGVTTLSKDTFALKGMPFGDLVVEISNPVMEFTVRQVCTIYKSRLVILTFGAPTPHYTGHAAEFEVVLDDLEFLIKQQT